MGKCLLIIVNAAHILTCIACAALCGVPLSVPWGSLAGGLFYAIRHGLAAAFGFPTEGRRGLVAFVDACGSRGGRKRLFCDPCVTTI